jgi:glycosyltransferase involved in cell wall biosynthesis
MRILLVHSVPIDSPGGAEISLRDHVAHAPPGVTVECVLPDSPVDVDRFDAVILANLRPTARLPKRSAGPSAKALAHAWLARSPLKALAFRSELTWVEQWCDRLAGYRGYAIRSERDVHPCAYRDGRCLATEPLRLLKCSCGNSVPKAFERLYNLCDAVHFLSPLHRQAINLLIRIDVPQFEIAPALDFERFRNCVPWEQRKRAALITGDAIRVSPSAERRARDAGYAVESVDYLSVPYARMPELLNQYQAVVVDPLMLHAFGRLAVEALACGCRVLASSRVGAMSWPDPLEACRQSNRLFWEMVTNVPKEKNPRRIALRGAGRGRAAQKESLR